ncbi:MAG TPA: alpha-2-macroglobulin family protein, partial [Prosthecobacter sp.]|nr:alpha-2-macroglobulin family protein [Prosthecobacter sp.]
MATKWRLRVADTLTNASGHDNLAEGTEISLGDVKPFIVDRVTAHTPFDRPYYLNITFNRSLLADRDTEWTAKEFDVIARKVAAAVHVDPSPADLKAEVSHRVLTLHGSFIHNTPYRVVVDPTISSGDELPLSAPSDTTVTFVPNPPYVAAPAFMRAQLAGGAGEFEFTAANVREVRVRIKRLNGSELLQAADKYEGYQSTYYAEEKKRKGYIPVSYDEYAGTQIFERTYPIDKDLDKSELVKLNWRDVLAGAPAAPLFIELEGRAANGLPQKGVITQTLVQFTDLGLMQKSNGRETTVFVTSLQTGQAVPGARLTMVDQEHKLIGFADTDASGIATLRGADPALVLAEKGGDCSVIRCLDGNYDSFVPYDINRAWENVWKPKRKTFIFSDRPLYRPGDTAHFKAHTRLRTADDLQLDAEPAAGRVVLRDARYRVVLEKPVTFTANGSWADDIKLPEGPLGWYNLSLRFSDANEDGNDESSGSSYAFRLDDYRPNTFEVKLDPAKVEFLPDRMKMPLSANYYMGKSLSQAKVSWHANSTRQFEPPAGFEDYHFGEAPRWAHYGKDRDAGGNYDDDNSESEGEWWVSGSVTVNDDGTAVLEMPLPPPDRAALPQQVTVGAEVTDINQQTVNASVEFKVPGSAFLLGLRGPQFFGTAGADMPLEIAAVDAEGKPGPAGVKVDVKIERQEYHTLKIATAGGGTTTKDQVILREELKQTVELKPASPNSPPIAALTFKPAKGGSYFLTAESTDGQGKKVLSRLPLYVIGGGEFPWAMEDGSRIQLQPEKKSLKPGEEAVIVVKTPIAGNALVTVERNRIHSHFITPVSPDQPIIRVPVQEGEAPNIFVSVIVIRGSQASPKAHKMPEYKVGYCELEVESHLKELTVTAKPDRGEVQPAESLSVTTTVTDHAAKPVANAEVTLYAVDEGVLSLMAHTTPDPSEFFHAAMPLAIDNFTSFDDLLPEEAAARERGNKGFVIGGGGEENDAPLQVRKNFVATPLWLATAVTDAEGKVTAAVQAPDNLTRYRIMAVAVSGADRFGSGEAAFKINKPLMVEPVIPRFARLNDEVLLKAVLHNTTPNSGEVEVTLELDATAGFIREPRFFVPAALKMPAADNPKLQKHTVTIAAGATTAVAFPVRFDKLGTARWKWTARTTKWAKGAPALNDATESTFEVTHPLPELREVRYVRLKGSEPPVNLVANTNPALLEGDGALQVSISTSRLYEAKDALDYVLTYPYGCAEQTTSATIPWLALGGYQTLFPDKLDAAKTKDAIQYGVNRLLQMATEEGGLAYWPGGNEPSLWASAYGGFALLRARDAGVAVPEEVTEKLLAYLSKTLRGLEEDADNYRLTDSALALYTLAKGKKPEAAYQNLLYGKREKLPEAARLYTALAMCLSNTPDQQIKDMLGWKPPAPPAKEGAKKQPKAFKARTNAPPPPPVWSHWAGNGPNRALRLIVYTHLGLTTDAEALAQTILQSRNGRGEWGNTYANAWTLTALAAYERSLKQAGEP